MGANTAIEWADHTFNPWIGCTKVSPGCDHCYAERDMSNRLHIVQWGAGQPRKLTSEANWRMPLRWNAQAEREGRRFRVFCASLADVFDNEVDPWWRADLFRLIQQTPHLDWLLLTKRVGNAHQMVGEALIRVAQGSMLESTELLPTWPWPNVWIGASIVNQAEADRDIPKLLAVPAAMRFLSMEPLLGPADIARYLGTRTMDTQLAEYRSAGVDWVIVGGESGPHARPMHPDWVRSLRDQCNAAGVPFFFKQWGEWADVDNGPKDDAPYEGKPGCWTHIDGGHHTGEMGVDFFNMHPMYRVGKKAAGRLLDYRTWDQLPA